MKRQMTSQTSAADTYTDNLAEARHILEVLSRQLDSYDAKYSERASRDWGIAGDMEHVRKQLSGIVESMIQDPMNTYTSVTYHADGEKTKRIVEAPSIKEALRMVSWTASWKRLRTFNAAEPVRYEATINGETVIVCR